MAKFQKYSKAASIVSFFALFSLSGCFPYATGSSVRALTDNKARAWIVDGKTTKEDLIQKLGQPNTKRTLFGIHEWDYVGSEGITGIGGGGSNTDYSLQVLFSKKNPNVIGCHKYYTQESDEASADRAAHEYPINWLENTCVTLPN